MAGLPVVGSATGATMELVQPGINGFLYNALESSALCKRLLDLDQDRSLVMKMKQNARLLAADAFSMQKFIDGTATVYTSVRRNGKTIT